jgi:hypothetical protein
MNPLLQVVAVRNKMMEQITVDIILYLYYF